MWAPWAACSDLEQPIALAATAPWVAWGAGGEMVQVQVKGKEWEKVEVNGMWRQESGSEQQGLEARQEPQKADQKK